MTTTQTSIHDPRIRAAAEELRERISARFPSATYALTQGMGDDPDGVYLLVTVDINDPDVVLDVVMERLLDLQLEQALPLYVLPLRTRERIAQEMAARGRLPGASKSQSR